MYFYFWLSFLTGLAVGSFLNVVIDRVPKGISVRGRSRCDYCGKQLRWFELIPLLSFMLQKGRCLRCGGKLSWQYPLVELANGFLFVVITLRFGFKDPLLYPLLSGLLALLVTDLKEMVLPDVLQYPLILLALGRLFLLPSPTLSLLGGLGVAGLLWLVIFLTRGKGMGFGDVKLGFLVGLVSAWPAVLVAVYLAFVLGGLAAVLLLVTRRKTFGQVVPFGPFLIAGAYLSLFLEMGFFEGVGWR